MVGGKEADTFLGIVMVYSRESGLVSCELAASAYADRGWVRVAPGHSLVPHGPPGSFDASVCFAAAHPLTRPLAEVGSHTTTIGHLLFYAAADGHHSSVRHNTISLATLRQDGFAGYRCTSAMPVVSATGVVDARSSSQDDVPVANNTTAACGVLTTRPVNISANGSTLVVTLDVQTGTSSRLRVALLDAANGQPIAGFTAANCVPLTATGTNVLVHWMQREPATMLSRTTRSGSGLSPSLLALAGKMVAVKFELVGSGVVVYSHDIVASA